MSIRAHQLALCTDLGASPASAPEFVELIPAGPEVVGRDGRRFLYDQAAEQSVLSEFTKRGIALPLDWEHASEHRAPKGEEAPAAAWIESLEARNGALWGRVSWTERGGKQVAAREYRFLSPVFEYDPKSGRVLRLVSAGLTNTPNLRLSALNREEPSMNRSTALTAAIVTGLGLAATADDDAIATAINQIKTKSDDATARALNAEKAQPSLDRYVPRADFDAMSLRATNAEKAVRENAEAAHKATVDTEIDAALKAGKITPATADYHRASCADSAGLERFRAFVKAAPAVAGDSGLDGKKPADAATALNAEEQAVARALGMTDAEYTKAKAA